MEQLKDKALKRAELTEEDILQSIEERTLARKNKEFSRSDQIRSDLAAKGIALMDVGNGTVWRPCVPAQPESSQADTKKAPPAQTESGQADTKNVPPAQPESAQVDTKNAQPAEKGQLAKPTDK